jgi:hypothetical protein
MLWNPLTDPYIESGYLGYGLRAIAHRNRFGTFTPSLEIREFRYGNGGRELLVKRTFAAAECITADDAMRYAMGKGQQVVDNLLELMNVGDSADHEVGSTAPS